VRVSKDPTTFTVLFEDSAALLGLAVAFLGISLGHRLDMPELDEAASVVIGVILGVVAAFLAYEAKGLLVGEGVDPRTRASIQQIVLADPDIVHLVRALSMHLGPDEVLLTLEIEFRPELSAAQAAAAVDRLDRAIRGRHPEVKHLFIEAQAIAAKGEGAAREMPARDTGRPDGGGLTRESRP
jgi:divalent metal cation (Fe/Co/Zn/Cd) transporter